MSVAMEQRTSMYPPGRLERSVGHVRDKGYLHFGDWIMESSWSPNYEHYLGAILK